MKAVGYMLGGVAIVSWVAILAVASVPWVVVRLVRGPIALVLVLVAAVGCGTVNEATGGLGLDFGTGTVWACEVEDAANGFAIVDLELCWKGSQDRIESGLWTVYGDANGEGFAICRHTDRHSGPCYWCCGADCPARGSNALNGMFCPPMEAPP